VSKTGLRERFHPSRGPSMSQTILITGASKGFGRDTAETLFRAGYTVYVSMRGAQGKNRQAAEAPRKLGIKKKSPDESVRISGCR
jgi:NAD(P)-dependent dehydrogenase (short-subunit alcohol dehydrogenase family)